MFFSERLMREVIRDFWEGILVCECASTRLKGTTLSSDIIISHALHSLPVNILLFIFSLSISIWIPLLSSAMTDSLWFTPSVLFSFLRFFCLWGKRSSIYLLSFNSYLDSYFFFPPLFLPHSFSYSSLLHNTLSHLPLSPSFLPLTPAQVKSDRWRPNADTLRPGPLLSGILYQDSKTGSIPPTEVEHNRKTK